jgi:hypothetical protein
MPNFDEFLFRGESERLDFKRAEYLFAGASDADKAKLLKDILSMANSWRDERAYILVGIDAKPGHAPNVIGITSHIDDAQLQEFVNSKTNRPVQFRYFHTILAGKTIGAFEIDVQERPIYLTKAFGSLPVGVVFTRHGSSNSVASPDEISRMGASGRQLGATDLVVGFASPSTSEWIGETVHVDCCLVTVAEEPDNIPDYREFIEVGNTGVRVGTHGTNPEFLRELVDVYKKRALLCNRAITFSNRGSVLAENIRVEFVLKDPNRDYRFCTDRDFPDRWPSRRGSILDVSDFKPVQGPFSEAPRIDFSYRGDSWHLAFEIKALQPGRTWKPAIDFYVGARKSGQLILDGTVLANSLPRPGKCALTLDFVVRDETMLLAAIEADFEKRSSAGEQ